MLPPGLREVRVTGQWRWLAVVVLAFAARADGPSVPLKSVTWAGWFSDLDCASGRASGGVFTATNPECAKKCLQKGTPPVFISEQARAIFRVKDYPSVIADLGYHLEVQAAVDEAAKTISIQKVKRLAYEGASCQRPKKSAAKP
jgi:hypothetical protein